MRPPLAGDFALPEDRGCIPGSPEGLNARARLCAIPCAGPLAMLAAMRPRDAFRFKEQPKARTVPFNLSERVASVLGVESSLAVAQAAEAAR